MRKAFHKKELIELICIAPYFKGIPPLKKKDVKTIIDYVYEKSRTNIKGECDYCGRNLLKREIVLCSNCRIKRIKEK